MKTEGRKILTDILSSVQKIEKYVGNPKKFEDYKNDTMVQQAVERNIEIIGEAVNRLRGNEPHILITNARKIISTRNRIIHGYDSINNAEIWAIIINHLPKLKEEVEKLLKEGEN